VPHGISPTTSIPALRIMFVCVVANGVFIAVDS
jgi:hypothetical protein